MSGSSNLASVQHSTAAYDFAAALRNWEKAQSLVHYLRESWGEAVLTGEFGVNTDSEHFNNVIREAAFAEAKKQLPQFITSSGLADADIDFETDTVSWQVDFEPSASFCASLKLSTEITVKQLHCKATVRAFVGEDSAEKCVAFVAKPEDISFVPPRQGWKQLVDTQVSHAIKDEVGNLDESVWQPGEEGVEGLIRFVQQTLYAEQKEVYTEWGVSKPDMVSLDVYPAFNYFGEAPKQDLAEESASDQSSAEDPVKVAPTKETETKKVDIGLTAVFGAYFWEDKGVRRLTDVTRAFHISPTEEGFYLSG